MARHREKSAEERREDLHERSEDRARNQLMASIAGGMSAWLLAMAATYNMAVTDAGVNLGYLLFGILGVLVANKWLIPVFLRLYHRDYTYCRSCMKITFEDYDEHTCDPIY